VDDLSHESLRLRAELRKSFIEKLSDSDLVSLITSLEQIVAGSVAAG
jgi:hypothetical protein